MATDWGAFLAALVAVLERERTALVDCDLAAIGEAATSKGTLVPRLGEAQARRRALTAEGHRGGLRSLARVAPEESLPQLRSLQRRAADLGERVFLLNRTNGALLAQGRDYLRTRMDRLRFRGGRAVLYGRQAGALAIGGASVLQRDL